MCPKANYHVHCALCIASHPARRRQVKKPSYRFRCTNCGSLTRPWTYKSFFELIIADLENLHLTGVDFDNLYDDAMSMLDNDNISTTGIKDILMRAIPLVEGKIDDAKLVKLQTIIEDELSTKTMVALQKIEYLMAP